MIGAAGIVTAGGLIGGAVNRPRTSQTSSGTTYGSTNTTGTGNVSGRTMPVVPDGWESLLMGMRPGANGLTPAQLTALTGMTNAVGSGTRALSGPANYFREFSDNPATTLEQLYARYPSMYQRPENVSPLTVTPQTGASFMDAYRNPFEEQVVAGVTRDLSRARDRRETSRQGQLQASGAFGGSATALENALIDDDFFNTLGDTVGGLRARNFEFAGGMGQADASRDLSGQVANQGAALTADTGNVDRQQMRQMFDVNSANENMRFRGDMAKSWANAAGLGTTLDNAALSALMTGGGVGSMQDLMWLRQFLPLFGSTNDATTTETTSGTQSGSQTGTGTGTMPGPNFGQVAGGMGNTLLMLSLLNGMGGRGGGADFGAPGAGAYPEFLGPWGWA